MSRNSTQSVRLGRQCFRGPAPFGESAASNPNFHMVDVLIIQLAPKAYFCSNNILLVVVALDHPVDVNIIEVQPSLIISIGHAQIVAHSHIEIERTILGNNDLMLGGRQSSTPPLDYISLLYLNVIRVHPVHKLLSWVQVCQNFVLFAPIVALNLLLSDAFLCQEVSLIGQASQNNLVSAKMHNRIRENVKDLSKYLFDQLVGLVESDIKRAHEPSSESASYSLILRCQTPASSVPRSVQLRNDSHSPPQPILNQFPCLLRRVGFFGREGSVLSDFWM